MVVNFTYNFREYGIKSIDSKASVLAKTIEHSLTSQMQMGVIDKREVFLGQLEELPNIDKIWLSRGHKVIEMYGKGFNNEFPKDNIDRRVLQTGLEEKVIDEKIFSNSTYRITIPYKATSTGAINCIQCHSNAKEGDTLGAITIVIPIDDSKEIGINTVFNTTIIALFLIAMIGFLINYLISPFLKLFDSIKKVMREAQKGDYSHRIKEIDNKEAKAVSIWINSLLEKLENTLGNIDSKISIFLSNKQKEETDPLINVRNTVDRLAKVYKFRKTIEQDDNLEQIYARFALILKKHLKIEQLNIFEADTRTGELKNVFSNVTTICTPTLNGCRADKTNTIVDSSQFENICLSCEDTNKNYCCIPYSLSNDLDLIISVYTNSEKEAKELRDKIPYIDDYIDAAKNVIISNKLMSILERSVRTDNLTQLYNRKHLEEQIPRITSQSNRSNTVYGVLMIDIDHFKIVNDTYGHDVGDNAIRIAAQTLLENIRTSDMAIRFGGEEFIILLHNCEEEKLSHIAEKIRNAFLKKEIPAGETSIRKTVSIGASIFPKNNNSLDTCIKYADLALYEAKNSGRNKVIVYNKDLLK
jgi:diguanylate cyclase (GGDEF)-like protein